MKILNVFDMYFVILVIIQGLIVGIYDSRNFKNTYRTRASRLAKMTGWGLIAISITLFIMKQVI